MSETILEIKNLSKQYGTVLALDNMNVKVQKGMIFGILGPNGSGKTTTLGIVLGVLNATSGSFSWFENGETKENRQRIGALLETPNFYPYLDAVQNLTIVSKIKEIQNIDEEIERVLKIVRLYSRKESKFKTFSLGMKQRLAIASALLNNPEVLVLDEPTNGLDPQGISEIRSLILEIAKDGKTILIASHALDEIEKVCTDVVILKNGEVIRQSKMEDIGEKSRQIAIKTKDNSQAKEVIKGLSGVSLFEEKEGLLILDVNEDVNPETINQHFFDKGLVLSELRLMKKSLETQFLEIIQE